MSRNKHRSFAHDRYSLVNDRTQTSRMSPNHEQMYVKIKSSKAFMPKDVVLVRDMIQKIDKIRQESEDYGSMKSKREKD